MRTELFSKLFHPPYVQIDYSLVKQTLWIHAALMLWTPSCNINLDVL